MLTIVCISLYFAIVHGCGSPPPPPTPAPTYADAPKKPPAPPPVVKVVRTQEQNMGFNKCYRKCDGHNVEVDASGNPLPQTSALGVTCERETALQSTYGTGPLEDSDDVRYVTKDGKECLMETKCRYECEFKVYTEVALRTISRPTGCGCAFHINIVKPRPAPVLGNTLKANQVATSVEVSDFELVVWNIKSNRVIEKIPEFKLEKDEATKKAIERQVKQGQTGDFTAVTQGFAGEVTRFEKLPLSLNLNFPENEDNVPALAFTVKQTYDDIKNWEPPAKPNLEQMPNAFQTQCVPYWPHKPYCYNSKKRQINKACDSITPTVWHKKFLLFPKESQLNGANVGFTYAARLITAFYTSKSCRKDEGILSIDSEFTQTLESTGQGADLALGTWAWQRVFVDGAGGTKFDTQYVLAVPGVFSPIQEVWDKGYSTIHWESPRGFTSAHEKIVGDGNNPGICQIWNPQNQPVAIDKYGETAQGTVFYKSEDGIKCAPFDDVIKQRGDNGGVTCGVTGAPDHSIMAFLNEGQILNFNKNQDSILLVGKMGIGKKAGEEFGCNVKKFEDTVFDVLTFHGVVPGQEPITRAERKRDNLHADLIEFGLIYDEEAEGLRHFLHKGAHEVLHSERKRAENPSLVDKLANNVATPPNEEDYNMRMAVGSVDMGGGNSADAGDHPLELLPDTFTAPVNIDPQADTPEIVPAEPTTGAIIRPCNRGSIGCSCRVSSATECDLGLECDSFKKCSLKSCEPGKAGCPCSGGECQTGAECVKLGKTPLDGDVCAEKTSCSVGTAGCECAAGNTCTDSSSCRDGICLNDNAGCVPGAPGCPCTLALDCNAEGFQCDLTMGACLAPRCKSGEPGCRCKTDGSCSDGFQCNLEHNVCSLFQCPAGNPGCQCLERGNKKSCLKVGFNCVDYSVDGDSRCVADAECDPQKKMPQKCNEICGGEANVQYCPPCPNGIVRCHAELNCGPNDPNCQNCPMCVTDPFGDACLQCAQSGAASSVALAIAATTVSVAALF